MKSKIVNLEPDDFEEHFPKARITAFGNLPNEVAFGYKNKIYGKYNHSSAFYMASAGGKLTHFTSDTIVYLLEDNFQTAILPKLRENKENNNE